MKMKHLTLKQAMQKNRKILLDALTRLGISKASIAYMGCGDSGGAENVTVEPADLAPALESENLAVWEWCSWLGTGRAAYRLDPEKPRSLDSALKLFVLDWLALEHPGWEINEGCQGTVTITVADNRCFMEHTEFYTESDLYEHSL